MLSDRAMLGVDGNAGFALLGENLQEGEAEFSDITEASIEKFGFYTAQRVAAHEALEKLRERLGRPDLNYWFGPSHPYGRD